MLVTSIVTGLASVRAHVVTVDGVPDEWLSIDIPENSWIVVGGEFIWHDAVGDTRNDFVLISIDGDIDDWTTDPVKYVLAVDTSDSTTYNGANLYRLFLAWDNTYLYIGLETSNTESWNVAYGIGIDAIPGQGYNELSGSSDAWSRDITFSSSYGIDYELYFYWDGASGTITSDNFCNWTGNGWNYYSISDINGSFASTGDSTSGLQFLEIKIPWSALGFNKPVNFSIIAWVAGLEGSSAVDTIPYDPAVEDNTDEWNDDDTLSSLVLFETTPRYQTIDSLVDITWFQLTSDQSYLYILIKFDDLYYIGQDGAPGILITIDTNVSDTTGETYFGYNSDTQVASNGSANWNRQILIDLANSAVQDGQPVYGDGVPVWNGGSPLDIVDTNWNDVSTSNSLFVVNITNNVVEIGIAWSDLGISDPANITLRIEVAVVRVEPGGNAWDIPNVSDVLDCITTTGPNTWDEVSDGYIDYYVDIEFNAIPEPIPEPGVIIGVLTVLSAVLTYMLYIERRNH